MSSDTPAFGGTDQRRAHPTFTVIIAVYNGVDLLAGCLDSLSSQSHDGLQVIAIDGGSTDGTVEVLRAHQELIGYWVSEPDRGITHAWNKALRHATGDWLLFLGADDRLAGPDVLATVARELATAHPPFNVAYGAVRLVLPDGSVLRTSGRPWHEARGQFRLGMAIPHQGTFHHRSLFEEHRAFDESYGIVADYDMLLRELLDNDPLFMPDLVVTNMGAGGVSDDADSTTLTRELHRVRYAHGLTRTPPFRNPAVLRAYARDGIRRIAGPHREARITQVYRRILRRPPR